MPAAYFMYTRTRRSTNYDANANVNHGCGMTRLAILVLHSTQQVRPSSCCRRCYPFPFSHPPLPTSSTHTLSPDANRLHTVGGGWLMLEPTRARPCSWCDLHAPQSIPTCLAAHARLTRPPFSSVGALLRAAFPSGLVDIGPSST
jgi:hypothetical protein